MAATLIHVLTDIHKASILFHVQRQGEGKNRCGILLEPIDLRL